MATPSNKRAVAPVRKYALALNEAALSGDVVAAGRYISRLSLRQLENRRRELNELCSQLVMLRRAWRKMEGKDIRTEIEDKGLAIRAEIQNYLDQETIGQMVRADRAEEAESEVSLLIAWVQDQLNVQAPLTDEQIYTAAAMIANQHYSLRIADIAICFRNGMNGRYNRQFGKIDVQDILSWVELYRKELNEQRQREDQSAQAAHKASKWDRRYSKALRSLIYNHQHHNK